MNSDHQRAVGARNAEYVTTRTITIMEYLMTPEPKPNVEALITWNLASPNGMNSIFEMLLDLLKDINSLNADEKSKLLGFARKIIMDERIRTNPNFLSHCSSISSLIEEFN